MIPQQQNTDLKGKSNVYVQKPDGHEINIPASDPVEMAGKKEKDMDQTASNTPSTHSNEVTDGEDA